MIKITYLIMFALVASGSVFTFFHSTLSYNPHSLLTIVSIFSHPIGKEFLGIPTYLPTFLIIILKWLMLFLVIYRLFIFIKNRNFVLPSNFEGILVLLAVIGIVAFILGEASILLNSLPLRIWDVLFHNAFPIAANILPLVFTVTELVAIKKPNPSFKRDA